MSEPNWEERAAEHVIGQRCIGGTPEHPHTHPTGPQVCLLCNKTLGELFAAAYAEGQEDGMVRCPDCSVAYETLKNILALCGRPDDAQTRADDIVRVALDRARAEGQRSRDEEIATLTRERDEAISKIPTDDPENGRLVLNAYGRRCYGAGQATAERELAEARAEAESLAWNLAGCSTFAAGHGLDEPYAEDLARPALKEVRALALREREARAELRRLRALAAPVWPEGEHS